MPSPQVQTTREAETSAVCSLGAKTSRLRITGGPRCTTVVERLTVPTRPQTLRCQDRGFTAATQYRGRSNVASLNHGSDILSLHGRNGTPSDRQHQWPSLATSSLQSSALDLLCKNHTSKNTRPFQIQSTMLAASPSHSLPSPRLWAQREQEDDEHNSRVA